MDKPIEFYMANCIERALSATAPLDRRKVFLEIAEIVNVSDTEGATEAHRRLVLLCNEREEIRRREKAEVAPIDEHDTASS